MRVQHIQKFIFQIAHYWLEDAESALLLKINYRDNTFEIEAQTDRVSNSLRNEAEEVARDLLSRKHGKNFAEK